MFDGTAMPRIGVFADATDYSMPLVDLANAEKPALIEQAGDLGVERVVFKVHDHSTDLILSYLDEAATILEKAFA